jgi:TRAP-type C4-dicarboxylate transport system permease large subunit
MGISLINLGIFTHMVKWIVTLAIPPVIILSAICLVYIVIGCFMSGLPAIVITLPITFPLIVELGYDPIWFGIIIVLLTECGFMTPPVGAILYVIHGLSPERSFGDILKGAIPFVFIIIAAIILLIVFPQIALFLPGTMFE